MIPCIRRSSLTGATMMNNIFTIQTNWLPEQSALSPDTKLAEISIVVNDISLTRNTNPLTNTISDTFIAAPYPLALWFLDNWWRLCFEATTDVPTTDWRMSHMLSAAGYGYCWPTIGFQSDSQNITITSIPTFAKDPTSAFYTKAYNGTISLDTFAAAIMTFVEDCMLHAADAELEEIFTAVQQERDDENVALYRTIEAMLGFDAGQGPEEKITQLLSSVEQYYGSPKISHH